MTYREGRGVGDNQAVSPRVFIDRATQRDEPSQSRCFPGAGDTATPDSPRAGTLCPGWRGGVPAGWTGGRGVPSAVGLAACLPSTLRSRRPPSLVKCCHLLFLRVIPLYEFFGLVSCQIQRKVRAHRGALGFACGWVGAWGVRSHSLGTPRGLGPPYNAGDDGRGPGDRGPPETELGGLPWGAGAVHPSLPRLTVGFLVSKFPEWANSLAPPSLQALRCLAWR